MGKIDSWTSEDVVDLICDFAYHTNTTQLLFFFVEILATSGVITTQMVTWSGFHMCIIDGNFSKIVIKFFITEYVHWKGCPHLMLHISQKATITKRSTMSSFVFMSHIFRHNLLWFLHLPNVVFLSILAGFPELHSMNIKPIHVYQSQLFFPLLNPDASVSFCS